MNLWHDIEPGTADEMNTIIEINRGSKNKYEIDKATGLIALDRVGHTAQDYPFDYGFVPKTLWDDGDAIDVLLLATYPIHPGVLVNARPVAVMEMDDDDESDWKIIAVPTSDYRWDETEDVEDLNKHLLKELQHFFENGKKLKKKPAPISIGGFKGKADAHATLQRAVQMYKEKFGK